MNASPPPARELALGAIFFAVAASALLTTRLSAGIALIWPANALVAALLIRYRHVQWPSAGIALFAASTLANAAVAHRSWPLAMAFAGLNLAEIALMVWTFRVPLRLPLPNISVEQGAVMTALFGIAIPGVTALMAGAFIHRLSGLPLSEAALAWWASHAVGACLVGPPIILFSSRALGRLSGRRFRASNLATLLIVLTGCFAAIRYVRFPFAVIGLPLLIAAFRVGAFGSSLLSLTSGLTIVALWSLGLRPEGLERLPVSSSLATLPVIALLATILPPIAVGLGTDARRQAVRRLNLSERRFRESMDCSPIGMLIEDLNGRWGYTNIALQTMLGYSAEELHAMPAGGPSDPLEWAQTEAHRQRLLKGDLASYDVERRFRHQDGHWVWTHVAASLVRGDDGAPQYLIAQIESLEARRRAEAGLAAERQRLQITLSAIADAVITTDVDARITYVNAAGERLLGQSAENLERRRLDEVMSLTDPATSKPAANLASLARVHGSVFRRETACVLHRPDGVVCYVRDVVSPVLDPHGLVTGLIVVLQDATADFERAREITHRASHDPLTGLANRFEFQRRLREVFRRARHTQTPAALVAIDLDRFKAVNDAGGHAAGDAMLECVTAALRSVSLRLSDTLARLGGDEFAVVLENCPPSRSTPVAQEILEALNPVRIDWGGRTFEIGASVGVALLTPAMESEAAWMAAADEACYLAKRAGRGQLRSG